MEIGERIKLLRKQKGLSQSELARLLGKSLRTVQKYESGEIDVSVSYVFQISDVLEVPPAYLFGIEMSQSATPSFYDMIVQELDHVRSLGVDSNDSYLKIAAALTVIRDYLESKA